MIDIRPETSIYSIFRHINYKKWNAIAEFVDNSIQSFQFNRESLEPERLLRIDIGSWRDESGKSFLSVSDNSFGIPEDEFERAFKPGSIPINRDGLSEFGVGMKFAACFFCPNWVVITTPYPPAKSYEFRFDVNHISSTNTHELQPTIHSICKHPSGGTTILMEGLYENIATSTLSKIKSHLAGIYRCFLQQGLVSIYVNGEQLSYTYPAILDARRAWETRQSPPVEWRQDINIALSDGKRITGFAAIREKASRDHAGFALFRRGRVVVGSEDETYRPRDIFGSSGGFEFQRIFGELHLHGFDVSHTKDAIQWGDSEDEFLYLLKAALDSDPFLLRQAREFRVGLLLEDKREKHIDSLGDKIVRQIQQNDLITKIDALKERDRQYPNLDPTLNDSGNSLDIASDDDRPCSKIENPLLFSTPDRDWSIFVSFVSDKPGEPLFSVQLLSDSISESQRLTSSFQIRLNSAHRFMEKYSSLDPDSSDGIIVLIIAVCIGEIKVRADGYHFTGALRRCVNELVNFL